jgi:hypothetical protein
MASSTRFYAQTGSILQGLNDRPYTLGTVTRAFAVVGGDRLEAWPGLAFLWRLKHPRGRGKKQAGNNNDCGRRIPPLSHLRAVLRMIKNLTKRVKSKDRSNQAALDHRCSAQNQPTRLAVAALSGGVRGKEENGPLLTYVACAASVLGEDRSAERCVFLGTAALLVEKRGVKGGGYGSK